MVFEGKTRFEQKIDITAVNAIMRKIRDNNLMAKNCEALPVMDYGATYKLTLDGKTREIIFPGCNRELGEIELLLPTVNMPVDGGS